MKRDGIFGLVIAGLALLLLWFLNRKGLLHEIVKSRIVTPFGTVMSDPETGFPQYDTRSPETVPEQEAFAVKPLEVGTGHSTQFPANPILATCPVGYDKWRNAADGSVWCLPGGIPVEGQQTA